MIAIMIVAYLAVFFIAYGFGTLAWYLLEKAVNKLEKKCSEK